MGLVVPLLRHWHPPSPLARLLILSFDISRSCLYLANRRKGDRTRRAGGRDSEEPREKPWKDRRESKQTERDRARSRGIGGRPRERERKRETERERRNRERSTTPGPKESETALHNATRQGKVQRGRSEPAVAGMDRGGSESWARNGRAKGAKGEGRRGREREGSKGTAGATRPTDRLPVSHPCSVVGVRSRRMDDLLGVVIRDDA